MHQASDFKCSKPLVYCLAGSTGLEAYSAAGCYTTDEKFNKCKTLVPFDCGLHDQIRRIEVHGMHGWQYLGSLVKACVQVVPCEACIQTTRMRSFAAVV